MVRPNLVLRSVLSARNVSKSRNLATKIAVDMRSDTVTQPSSAMRNRMACAIVGDDVYGEDPTVKELEQLCAKLLGKEKALFFPSATMSNLCAVLAHCRRGDRVIVGSKSHIFCWEQGGACSVAGCMMHPLHNNQDGSFGLDEFSVLVEQEIDDHCATNRLVCLENTHGGCGGVVVPEPIISKTLEICRLHGLATHLDGARIFNASVACNLEAERLCKGVDSVTVCLSKGLGAPMGALLCGTAPLISQAMRARKLLGGALRQVGIVAAAGIEALHTYPEYLVRDHRRAADLAKGLEGMSHVQLLPPAGQPTNMVFFRVGKDVEVARRGLAGCGVLVSTMDGWLRAVTHRDLSDEAVPQALAAVEALRGP